MKTNVVNWIFIVRCPLMTLILKIRILETGLRQSKSLSRNLLSNSVCFVIGYVLGYSQTFETGQNYEPSYSDIASVYS